MSDSATMKNVLQLWINPLIFNIAVSLWHLSVEVDVWEGGGDDEHFAKILLKYTAPNRCHYTALLNDSVQIDVCLC